eukprot:TRINITY_DN9835_c0_g1_i1.p12 TRINITY_DN9835_c0_g1~~TRINITY_DN9835_c0_g1_i1.p12  ORF type:complete len:117 (+),score=2.64 TRINITY_DN9835_c0_g1_i1:286-636(+)
MLEGFIMNQFAGWDFKECFQILMHTFFDACFFQVFFFNLESARVDLIIHMYMYVLKDENFQMVYLMCQTTKIFKWFYGMFCFLYNGQLNFHIAAYSSKFEYMKFNEQQCDFTIVFC